MAGARYRHRDQSGADQTGGDATTTREEPQQVSSKVMGAVAVEELGEGTLVATVLGTTEEDAVPDGYDESPVAKARAVRKLAPATALEQLGEHRRGGAAKPRRAEGGAVRVSLVQRHRGTGIADESDVEYAEANDGLPTATVDVGGARRQIKLDSCARFIVAGTGWMKHGDEVEREAPVGFVEGIGGFLLDVVGVWRFSLRSVFGEIIEIDACIVEGDEELLLGVDFMKCHGAVMDFGKNEVRYREAERVVVLPFQTFEPEGGARVAVVRLVQKTQVEASVVVPSEVAVPAADGKQGVFVPTSCTGSVMLAATVTKAQGGRAWVPAINSNSQTAKLPNKKELGVWIPIDEDMTILTMSGKMDATQVSKWIEELGDSQTPLRNEDELQVDTGDAAPILLKRRRQAQSEDPIVDNNVEQMLGAGVIEESQGTWGFPVVLVKKKDGEIRFCVDYRALNKVAKKDVYPLPRIDETLEALRGALLFSTLDLKSGYWQIFVAPEDRDKTAFTTKRGLYRFVRMPFG
ncbi:unnamed protein product [Phytophthora fragariaefolia]|uniref:Unnamed protein product n=1 Tax=Phytophthora fragariaefolia TaxID=1490495 RepID=A0A9W6YBF8_9STRA|nr:unnamed protein product [Phytophthora fragariaefolia]